MVDRGDVKVDSRSYLALKGFGGDSGNAIMDAKLSAKTVHVRIYVKNQQLK